MLKRLALCVILLSVFASEATGQTASFKLFGQQCTNSVRFGALSLPVLGKTMRIFADAPWKAQGRTYLVTGTSNTRFANVRLPWDTSVMSNASMWWCGPLNVSIDDWTIMRFSRIGTDTLADFPIPNDSRLLGVRLYHQALLWRWALGTGKHHFRWSRGAVAVIGR